MQDLHSKASVTATDLAATFTRNGLIWKVLTTAILYTLAGLGGLYLTHSTGYTTPIWPAAGMAVATLLAWGNRCWPGIWLGGILIDQWIVSAPDQLGLSALLAGAVTTQALLSARLSRSYLLQTALGGWRLARPLLAAGPLACLIASTLGCFLLLAGGRIGADQLYSEWLRWWIGDSLGVLLFAPMVRLLWPGQHPLRVPGGFRYVAPLLITAVLLVFSHGALERLNDERQRSATHELMEVVADSASLQIAEVLHPLQDMAHVMTANPEASRLAFGEYARRLINDSVIQSVDWAPRVLDTQRAAFEAAATREGFPGYRIVEPVVRSRMQPAPQRAEYFPILFSEPMTTNRQFLGLDHAWADLRRRTMTAASAHAQVVASELIRSPRSSHPVIALFVPVIPFASSTHKEELAGYLVGIVNPQQLFAPLLSRVAEYKLALRITDITPNSSQRVLAESLPNTFVTKEQYDLPIAGRIWRLEMGTSMPLWQPGLLLEEHLFLGFAMLTAFLASFTSLSSARQQHQISQEVELQTLQLAKLNEQLKQRIEERAQIITELTAKEEEIHTILDSLVECVITIDGRGIVQRANPAIEPLLGYTPAALVGRPISTLIPRQLRAKHGDLMRQAMESHLESSERYHFGPPREVTGLHKDGYTVELEISISEYQANDEQFFISTLRNISERKALIASLAQARTDAEQANRAKSAFLAAMSHEIRTPMNGVIGLLDVLDRDPMSPPQANLLKTIRDSANSLLVMIDDILDFSRIEAGKLDITNVPLPLVELITGVCATLRPLATSRNVVLELDIAVDLPSWVLSDAVRLRQILYNLIGNAIKFSSGNVEHTGQVTVRVRPTDRNPQHVAFVVEDNGIGIAPEHQERIFSAFTQAESSTTRRFGGNGLGLTICKRLVELMDGEIAVASTQGVGSTFTVTLPLLASEAPKGVERNPLLAVTASTTLTPDIAAGYRILVVEDDTVNSLVIQQQLSRLGYRFEVASHGAEALLRWRQGGFDLVLSDLHMPEMDGYQLTASIRQEEGCLRHTPILLLTANALRDEMVRAQAAGVDDYLTKPIRLATLEAALGFWLRLHTKTLPNIEPFTDAPLFDPKALSALLGDDTSAVTELLREYVAALHDLAPRLQTAFAHGDTETIGTLAHRLKSSSRAVGAMRLGQLCRTLERIVRSPEHSELASIFAGFRALWTTTATQITRLLDNEIQA